MTRFEERDHRVPRGQVPDEMQTPDRLRWQPIYPQDIETDNPLQPEPVVQRLGRRMPGLVALVFLAAGIAIVVMYYPYMAAFLSTMTQVGSGTPDEQVRGLLAVGFLGVIVVAIVRILTRKD